MIELKEYIAKGNLSSLFESDIQFQKGLNELKSGKPICCRNEFPIIRKTQCVGIKCGTCPISGSNLKLFLELIPKYSLFSIIDHSSKYSNNIVDKYFPKIKELD